VAEIFGTSLARIKNWTKFTKHESRSLHESHPFELENVTSDEEINLEKKYYDVDNVVSISVQFFNRNVLYFKLSKNDKLKF
jgi:hypothetical protein